MKSLLTIVSLGAGIGFGYMQHASLAPKLAFLNQPAKSKSAKGTGLQLASANNGSSLKSKAVEHSNEGNSAVATSANATAANTTTPVGSGVDIQPTTEHPSQTQTVEPQATAAAEVPAPTPVTPEVVPVQPKSKPSPDGWKLCKEVTLPPTSPTSAPQKLAEGTAVYVLANMNGNVVVVTKGEKRSAAAVPADAVASADGQNPQPAAYAAFDQSMLSRIDELVNDQMSKHQAENPQAAGSATAQAEPMQLLGDLPLKKLMRESLQAKPLQNMPISSIKKVTYLGQQLFDGKQSELGEVEFEMQSIMGEMPMKAVAVFRNQKLVGWYWAKSHLPIR